MQYKRVISFGDSFTFGNDLADWRPGIVGVIRPKSSVTTWPALVANYLNIDYECYAESGSSNSTILRTVLSTKILPTDLVIVNWTWIDRWDFYNGKEWSTLRPSGTEDNPMYKIYYKHFQSELWDKYETLKNIQTAFSVLDNVISTAIDPLTVDTRWHCPPYIKKLVDTVSKKITWFDGKGFFHWAQDKNFPISDKWHPLEEAHRAAFEYIKNEFAL